MFGPTKNRDGKWRIKTNDSLNNIIRNKNVINCCKSLRLSWFGHVQRMTNVRLVSKLCEWKPIPARLAGRPKIRWENDVEED
jgi:hypothetical protein